MKNKTLAIFGVGTYILSIIVSATNQEGSPIMPIILITISAITTLVFIIMATMRLWKKEKIISIVLAVSYIISSIGQVVILSSYGSLVAFISNITKVVYFFVFFYSISSLWTIAKREGVAKKMLQDSGLTPEEVSLFQEYSREGKHKQATQLIAVAQERQRAKFKEDTGIDLRDIIPEIGQDISWADIVNQVFRVLEFDRSDTTVEQNNQVKAQSLTRPYGYLFIESPILNQKARLPIIHRDDFLLIANAFDNSELSKLVSDGELLVTYVPKHLLPKGLSGSPHHVLHYAITPRGTLDFYYSMDNDIHMTKPEPQRLFGSFVYQGEIKVQVNLEPKL